MLDGIDGVALLFEGMDSIECGGEVLPCHRVFSTKGCLVYFGMWRLGGDATEVDGFDTEGVGGAEDATHVVHAPYIVKHNYEGHLF